MLDENLKTQLQGFLDLIAVPIELVASLDNTDASRELGALLGEIAALSPKISMSFEADGRTPSFLIRQVGDRAVGVRFAGIPLGHEFTSLVLALLQVGGYPPKVDAEVIDQVRSLEMDLHFESYYSLSCQNCPDVVQALNLMAVLNPRITHTAVDGALFQAEVNGRDVMAVPAVYLNGQPFAAGRMDLAQILAKLDSSSGAREARRIAAKAPYDMLIIGGGPAGAAAAIYAARKGIRTGIATERFGGQVLDTLGIENFISVRATEGPKLVAALEQHIRDYDVDVVTLQRAERLVPAVGRGLHEIQLASGASLKARTVVIATGARWRTLNVPGEDQYRNRGVAFCPHCDGPLYKGKRVAVVGGGNSGVEAAIDLAGIVAHVTLIEFDARLRADDVLQKRLRSLANVDVIVSAQTTEIIGDGQRVTGLAYRERDTGAPRTLVLDGVFVQIGLLPNTDWLKGALALSRYGEIEIDERGATSIPGVYAAGDATTVPYKQIVIAMGEGSKAALGAFDHLIRHSSTTNATRAA